MSVAAAQEIANETASCAMFVARAGATKAGDRIARELAREWQVQISLPVLLLRGRRDEAAPFSRGKWLTAHIPAVEAWLLDNETHGYCGKAT